MNKYLKNQILTQSEIDEMIKMRRYFHSNPELGFKEFNSSKVIAKKLKELGYEVTEGIGKTGVIGLLKNKNDPSVNGKTLMLRADMDALPIQELNDIEYKSKVDGVMHACGHDGHMAILLTVSKKLMEIKDKIKGQVKVVFQPAEEGLNGALHMVNDGVLENPKVDNAIGLHVFSTVVEIGEIGIAEGGIMAGVGEFKLIIKGKGGHGALPDETKDPIVISANIITTMQTIISRNLKPLDAGVVTFGTIKGGDSFNIIPGKVEMTGTVRTFNSETYDLIKDRFEKIVKGITEAYEADYELTYTRLNIPTVNDPEITNVVRKAAKHIVGENKIVEYRTMGGEDMSEYLARVPGCFFFVGAKNSEKQCDYPHHNARFNIDEDSLIIGAEMMLESVKKYFGI